MNARSGRREPGSWRRRTGAACRSRSWFRSRWAGGLGAAVRPIIPDDPGIPGPRRGSRALPGASARGLPSSAGDDVQVARRLVEGDRAGIAADDDVLDSGPVAAVEVDARLDAEGRPDPERLRVSG